MLEKIQIALVANDVIAAEFARCLSSLRRHSPETEVLFIPFNENDTICRGIAATFGAKVYQKELSKYETFGREIFDADPPQQPYPYMLGKMRKLAIFDIPGPIAYLDADAVITSNLGEILTRAAAHDFDVGYISVSHGWVFETNAASEEILGRSRQFSTSFLLKKSADLTFDVLASAVRGELELYHQVRKRGVVDQPMLNFAFDRLGLKLLDLPACLDISGDTVATRDLVDLSVSLDSDGRAFGFRQSQGKKAMAFLHAVGQYKHSLEFDYIFKSHLFDAVVVMQKRNPALCRDLVEAIAAWSPKEYVSFGGPFD
jgi:hypothetical protein